MRRNAEKFQADFLWNNHLADIIRVHLRKTRKLVGRDNAKNNVVYTRDTFFIEQLYKQMSSFLLWKVLLTQADLVLSDVADFVRGGTAY